MSSDDATRLPDVPFKAAGPGLSQSFKCGQCGSFRAMGGRRFAKVRLGQMRGIKAWLCAQCIGGERNAS